MQEGEGEWIAWEGTTSIADTIKAITSDHIPQCMRGMYNPLHIYSVTIIYYPTHYYQTLTMAIFAIFAITT